MATPESKCQVVFAPNKYTKTNPTVFLSGSIDALPATWQSTLTSELSHLPITILNPHREDWNSSWKEDILFEPFREQVTWELAGMETADVVAIYFNPKTKAPITLVEFGLFAMQEEKCVVACPEGYWKRGNVQIICGRYGIELVETVAELAEAVKRKLEKLGVRGE